LNPVTQRRLYAAMLQLTPLLRFLRPYWLLAAMSLVLLVLLAGMDLAIPRLIQYLIDEGIAKGDHQVVVRTALTMLALSAVSFACAIANNAFSVRAGEGVARDLREALFVKVQSYSFADLDTQKTGDLLVRLTGDVNSIKALTQMSLRIGTRAPLMMLGSLILMVQTSRELALTLLPLLLTTCALIVFFVAKTGPLFLSLQAKVDALNGVLQENITGARLVKALVREAFEASRFENVNAQTTVDSIRVMRWGSAMTPALTLCVNLGTVVVIWAGGMTTIDGALTLGQIVAFTNYLLSTMVPLAMMTMLANVWASGIASASRIASVFSTEPAVRDVVDPQALPTDNLQVNFESVSFSYLAEAAEPVLRDIALSAKPGQTVALLGPTGAGKSTLVQLIPRFYDVTHGSVRIANIDVKEVSQVNLLEHVGMVPQVTVLFAGTVRDNIRYGRPSASDEEVEAAARAAQAHEFILRLPHGYDAIVEPRASNFSGGQRQRLALARALLLEPEVLILDDATSAVDAQTEANIRDALALANPRRITFVVAQRITTVLHADQILVLDKGQIASRGTHQDLLRTSTEYREIYESQLGALVGRAT
jgi:ATP-binding cassette, subfamily B, multidrug efflux pump